ncbi:MAG: hypothetical protein E6R04_06670 [Spirochaetes bacterium]|nr:MAG: hypothetical protein E6R04_06670 [Spirochaetota bacterium]
MVVSPFDETSRKYTALANSLNDSKNGLSGVEVTGSGATVKALNERIESTSKVLETLSEHAVKTSDICNTQVPVDGKLLSAPGPKDVETAKEHATLARRMAMEGRATPIQLQRAQDAYNDAKSQRDAAYAEHEAATQGRKFTAPPSADTVLSHRNGPSPNLTGLGALSPGGPGGPGSGGGDGGLGGGIPDDSSFADTHLSGDSGPVAAPAATMAPQQMGGQPGGGMPMGGAPQMPQMAPMPPSAFKDIPKGKDLPENNLPEYDLSDTDVGTVVSGDSSSPASSGTLTGASTRADVTGAPSGAVSAGGGMRGGDAQQGPMMRGGMGGMPMGGMGHGGGNTTSKERPEIFTEDKDLLGTETAEAGVEGGLIGRSTSSPSG